MLKYLKSASDLKGGAVKVSKLYENPLSSGRSSHKVNLVISVMTAGSEKRNWNSYAECIYKEICE